MFGEKIGFNQAALVCIFSIVVVFFVLVIISYLIDLVAFLIKKGKKEIKENKEIKEVKETTGDTEIAAVAAAAIAAYLGVDSDTLVVRKIMRLGGSDSPWAQTARQEYINK